MLSSSCVIHLKVRRLSCSTFRSLRPSTTPHWKPVVSWQKNWGLMRPTPDLLWARGWVVDIISQIYPLLKFDSLGSRYNFFSCRFFNMTCGIKLQQIYGTGRHWRRKLPSESSRRSFFVVVFIAWRLQNRDSPLPLSPLFVLRHGVRNSLLLAPMPTASTAQILGNNESIEPYTSNIYTRRVLSGEFQVSINATEYFTVCN